MIEKLTNAQQEKRKEELKLLYFQKGIKTCEINLPECAINWALGFVHKSKRIEYVNRPLELWTFKETIFGCTNCHQLIEGRRDLTNLFFRKLRSNVKT
jgi:hypothetical protein